MVTQGKVIIYAAIAGLLAMLGGFTWYASLDNPKLDMAEIQFGEISLVDTNTVEDRATLEVGLKVRNPSDKSFTISNIDYELSANGKSLGRGQYSAQDVPLPGRPIFGSNTEIELPSTFNLVPTPDNREVYDAIVSGQDVHYTASGMMVVESSWSLVEKEFEISE